MATSLIGPNPMGGSYAAQSNLQQSREMQLLQQLNSTKDSTDDAKIEKGAKQFESMLLGSWLQQAEQSFATIPGAEDDDDAAGREQMMSLGVQSLAESLTASGGIGIAKMIAKAMHANAKKADEAAETGAPVAGQAPSATK